MMSACALCGESLDRSPLVSVVARHGHVSRRVACARCSLVQVSPQPSPEALTAYYCTEYRREFAPQPAYIGNERIEATDPRFEMILRRGGEQYASLVANHSSGRTVLELGAGDGHVLDALRSRGYETSCMELDAGCAVRLHEKGHKVLSPGWRAPLVGEEGSQACVLMVHSLEHMIDPMATLRAARLWLRRTGTLIVEVPNVLAPYGDLDTWFFQHVHLFDFSPFTLSEMLRLAGFQIRELHTQTAQRAIMGCDGGIELRVILAIAQVGHEPTGEERGVRPSDGGQWVAGYLDCYRALVRG